MWSIHRAYRLVCGLASAEGGAELRRRRLQVPDDRRDEERTDVCLPLDLTPVRPEGDTLRIVGPPVAAVTRDLASHGVGLRHDRELPTRFAIAEFDIFGDPVYLLVELCWTYEEGLHSFSSGGRLVAVVDPKRFLRQGSPSMEAASR